MATEEMPNYVGTFDTFTEAANAIAGGAAFESSIVTNAFHLHDDFDLHDLPPGATVYAINAGDPVYGAVVSVPGSDGRAGHYNVFKLAD